MKDAQIVGEALAAVLPQTDKYWFQQRHLLILNTLLLVPLLSSSTSGYDGSLMNGLQSLEQWQDKFGAPQGALLGLVNAAQAIGSVVAVPFVGDLSDRFGRKNVLASGAVIIIIATIIQACSIDYAQFVVARAITGFGGSCISQPAPMLIGELAYPLHRGKYTSAFWCMYYLGAILASWTTFGTQGYTGDWAWRAPTIVQAAIPLIQLILIWFVPESPRWLVSKDRTPEAARILAYYHAGEVDTAGEYSPLVQFELTEITQSIQAERSSQDTSWAALFRGPGNRRRMFLTIFSGLAAQWNGIGIVSYYLTLVLNSIGITDSYTQTLINGLLQVFNFICAIGAAFLVDKLGRKTLFVASSIGMLVAYIVWTACSALVAENGNHAAGIVVVVTLFLYYLFYDIAWTPLLFAYPAEILPFSMRSKGLAIEFGAVYGSLTVAAFTNPIGIENLGWKMYAVYCAILAVFLGIVCYFYVETKGHSLEEIAVLFDGKDVSMVEPEKGKDGHGFEGAAMHAEDVKQL